MSDRSSPPRSPSAARSGQAGRGAVLLLAYAFGIGVPFLLAALGLASSPALAERLRRAGPTIERVAGVLLLVLGVLLATGTYSHLTSYLAVHSGDRRTLTDDVVATPSAAPARDGSE